MENIFRNHVDAEQSAVCPACGCILTPMQVGGQMVYRCAPGCAFSGRVVYRETPKQHCRSARPRADPGGVAPTAGINPAAR